MNLTSWRFLRFHASGRAIGNGFARSALICMALLARDATWAPHRATAESIYWINSHNDSVQRANLDGTNVATVVPLPDTMGDISNENVVVDWLHRQVYWTQFDEHLIQRASFDGTGVETLHSAATGSETPQGLALDIGAGKMYWLTNSGKLWRANLDGGGKEQVIDLGGFGPQGLVIDPIDQRIYISDHLVGGILRVNTDGTGLETIVPPAAARAPADLDIDVSERRVYWTNYSPLGVASANLDGTNIEQIVSPSDFGISSLAVDSRHGKVYWTNPERNAIYRVDKSGANIQTIVTGNIAPRGIDIDPVPPPQRIAGSEFSEAAVGSSSYLPAAGAQELGFRTTSTPTAGQNPTAQVIATGGLPGNVLRHQSVAATSTFDEISLLGLSNVEVSLRLQVDVTNYETGDFVRAVISNGNQSITLFDLQGGGVEALDQAAGEGFTTFRGRIPDVWTRAILTLTSFSNSSTGAEQFDFDTIEFTGSPLTLEARIDTNIFPSTADDTIDLATGLRVVHGLARSGRHTLGYLNHPGEPGGNLQLWFDLVGLDPPALDALALELDALDGVLAAGRVQGSPFLETANLHVVFAGGAAPGLSRTLIYDFGDGVYVRAVAIAEPAYGTPAICLLLAIVAVRRFRGKVVRRSR
jgi:hypothetical protein